ncbi:hypothetical protein Tco_0322236 [Tanacetum coccineum]
MASFDYRLNPFYAIKECSSCGTLCTRDCGCSKGSLEDKILVPDEIDFLLDEFAGELTRLQSIPSGIDNINLDPEGDILFLESLLYDNSSPRLPEEFNYENPTESFSPSHIPVEDSDSLMEEIDIFLDGDDSIPTGIESGDFDSEDDDNSTSRPEFESFHVDYPNSGNSTIDVVEDIPVDVPNILPTHPALLMDFDFIPSNNDVGSDLDDSSPSEDRNKIYDLGICIEVKSTGILALLSPEACLFPIPCFVFCDLLSRIARILKPLVLQRLCPSVTRALIPQRHSGESMVNEVVIDVVVNEVVVMDEVVGIWMVLDWYGYQEKDKNKDNTRQSRARD